MFYGDIKLFNSSTIIFWGVDFDRCSLIKEAKARDRGAPSEASGDDHVMFVYTRK